MTCVIVVILCSEWGFEY